MTDLARITPDTALLATWPTADLRAELSRGLTLAADHLARLSLVWAELERRGEDLSDLRRGLARHLPRIAAGQLAAEAVVAFAGRPRLLDALVGVPLGQQRDLAAGKAIPVIDPASPDTVEEIPLAALPAAAIGMVIADGEIRPPAAQRLALRARRQPRRRDADPDRRYRPRYDPETGAVTVGRMTVQMADLLAALSAAAGPDRPPPDLPEEYDVVRVRLTHEEYARFQAACRRVKLPEWEMARKALRAFGLI